MTDQDQLAAWWAADEPEFLLHSLLISGIGMAAIGADRGSVGPSLVCRADSAGPGSAVITASNVELGRSGCSAAERAAARDSFAESVLAQCRRDADDNLDIAPLALVDLARIGQLLSDAKERPYLLDRTLSRVDRVTWYDDILAVEAVLTFSEESPKPSPKPETSHSPRVGLHQQGSYPAPADTVSVRQQITLRRLPTGFEPTIFDPTAGALPFPLVHRFDRIAEQDAITRYAQRHRVGPDAPIVFHLDPAMPEQIRQAVLTGGNWWAAAFDDAGLPNGYRVQMLPEGRELQDPRLNVVYWTHRADRGWSYGMTQEDPRTGEILRGTVVLGSQRVEQVRAIAEAVLAPYGDQPRRGRVDEVVLARLRQLAAHEIGHAIGFAHNFATHQHPVPSVMDYPAPIFAVDHGTVIAPRPYATGLGPWDRRQVAALYGSGAEPTDGDELIFVTDADARTDEAADGSAATWIMPGPVLPALHGAVTVRATALQIFSPAVAPPGSDSNEIERRFLLVYLLHRHQAIAAAKLIGGTVRRYARVDHDRFDGSQTPVPVGDQLRALAALYRLLDPEFLAIGDHIRPLLVPPSGGAQRREGQFDRRTANSFDSAAAISAGTDLVGALLLAPERLNRLVEQNRAGAGADLGAVLASTVGRAVELLQRPGRAHTDETIGWTLLRRYEQTLASEVLHHGTRVATFEALGAPEITRPALRHRWEALEKAAFTATAELPPLPPGTPI